MPRRDAWRPDSLLDGFESLDLPLAVDPLPGEPDEPLVGTLVRRADPALRASRRAILSLHGWNDYFFHVHVAEFAEREGFAFYALDLRRYGRSHREGQFFGYIGSLEDYAAELDAALAVLEDAHDEVALMGHSTGGLTASLWASANPGRVSGLMLNSPWLDLHGPPAFASVLKPLLAPVSRRSPTRVLPMPENEHMVYARSIHTTLGGEWDYSLDLKSPTPRPILAGWLRAVLHGHASVARGLSIECPVIVATSSQTAFLRRFSPRAREADVVLDVERVAAAAWRLGPHVTLVRVEGGLHDLSLSREPARTAYLEALSTWLQAYLPGDTPGAYSGSG